MSKMSTALAQKLRELTFAKLRGMDAERRWADRELREHTWGFVKDLLEAIPDLKSEKMDAHDSEYDRLVPVQPEAENVPEAPKPEAKPHWPDHCKHTGPLDKFLGTVTAKGPVDVYVYRDHLLRGRPRMHICIRYGSEGSHYLSPGEVGPFVESANPDLLNAIPEYGAALPLLRKWLAERDNTTP